VILRLNFTCRRFGTLCSIFIVYVNKNNNWNEIARVFIYVQVQVSFKISLGHSGGGGTGRGCVRKEEQAVGENGPKWRPVVRQEYVGETALYRSEDLESLIRCPTLKYACRI